MNLARLRAPLAWCAIAAGAAALAAGLYLAPHLWEHRNLAFPPNLGNARAAALLAPGGSGPGSLVFAVIGDVNRGFETFEAVAERLREERDVDFLVLLGDCAADPNLAQHRFFIKEFAETGLRLPTFIIAGNHDLRPGEFERAQFEALYGPANFSFFFRGCLFVGLGAIHDREMTGESLRFLEGVLRENRERARLVFVFMHFTAQAAPEVATNSLARQREFQRLFEQYRVDYVFSGHDHRLGRTLVNGVVYFISGGGGAELRASDAHGDIGLFHHLTIIRSREGVLAEQIVPIPPAGWPRQVLARLERGGVVYLPPWIGRHPFLAGAAPLALLAAFAWGLRDRRRARRRRRAFTGGAPAA